MSNSQDENLDSLKPNDDGTDGVQPQDTSASEYTTTPLSGMYKDWFLDYASYVILERAVPEIRDGLKPVQRRILHSMKEMDDGRYNKVANIIGNTMKFHPHGDASIGDALVQLGQKDLLVDTQGNWGNILTGDSAAAPRYIEARPSKFALEVLFNPKTTLWKPSYDGRNKEPITLPVKFPLLLAQGVEGIAVGLASKILPHNFVELIDASIGFLQGKEPDIYPDFSTGGMADFSKYNGGLRGGKVRVRARINILDKKTLVITEIPFATTTGGVMDSIVAANDKGKIKIRKIEDNTAANVEILVHLMPGISPDQAIDALYAFTDCEISISPNACVIEQDKPRFLDVNELLKISVNNTLDLLRRELEIEKHELLEQLLYSSLEKIFIEKRIYRKIEECETWESVIETIDKGLNPYKKLFYREITRDDITRLTEIKIKRISRYDAFRADELMANLEERLEKVNHHLENLVQYAIDYYQHIRDKYGKGRERKTEVRLFDTIEATRVAVANAKLYVNREEGFAGTSMKKDEYVCDCSDIDDIIVFREDGKVLVTKVADKSFVGKGIIHIAVFERNDDRTIYNMIYQDGNKGSSFMKRFAVKGVTRDKEYDLTKGTKGSKVLYFTPNPNGEAEVVTIYLRHKPKLRKPVFDLDFADLAIKGRSAAGNLVTKHPIRKVVLKDQGVSTLGAMDIWFDETVLRLNADKRGSYLGAFKGDDKLLAVYANGTYRIIGYDLSTHFDEKPMLLRKMKDGLVLTAVFFDAEQGFQYLKRFEPEGNGKPVGFIGEHRDNKLLLVSDEAWPRLKVNLAATARKPACSEEIDAENFIAVKSYKARGKRLAPGEIESMEWLEPLRKEEAEPELHAEDSAETQAGTPAKEPTETEGESRGEDGLIFEWVVGQEGEVPTGKEPGEKSKEEGEEEDGKPKPPRKPRKKSDKPDDSIKPGDREKQIRLDLDI
ncbi:MAG: DNA gyrase/topoisomerase IV subunit A [Bacteroidales bacterium]|nr:DNA gyrase/topoisomerase IV subunit A [Bacteroidales bacterium]NLM92745.1 DNA gyrase/topoisomerase IV subunit A [Bacteroidales bacterium]